MKKKEDVRVMLSTQYFNTLNDHQYERFCELSDSALEQVMKRDYTRAVSLFENAKQILLLLTDVSEEFIKNNLRFIQWNIRRLHVLLELRAGI
jgi:hypothetical protein